jgi:hypothetical protein
MKHKANPEGQVDGNAPHLGAVLIKNYASLDKNEKKFHVFFLKIVTYQSTPKILYVQLALPKMHLPGGTRQGGQHNQD